MSILERKEKEEDHTSFLWDVHCGTKEEEKGTLPLFNVQCGMMEEEEGPKK